MRSFCNAAGVALGLGLLVLMSPGSAWGQGRVERETQIEFGGLLSSMDPATAAAEGIRGWPYGIRIGGAVAEGMGIVSADVGTLSFPEDRRGGAARYKTSAYLGSVAVGIRTPRIRTGRYDIIAGTNVGTTWMNAFRSRRGWSGSTGASLPDSLEGVADPQIRSGLFAEPAIQIQGEEVGVAVRFRVYDGSSSLQRALLVSWFLRMGDAGVPY